MIDGRRSPSKFALLLAISLGCTATALYAATAPSPPRAAAPSPATGPGSEEPIYEVAPQLQPPGEGCLDRWSEALGAPSDLELDWRKRINHGIYRIGVGDTLLARVELLSTAMPSRCDVDPDWKKRQTQILVTYYLTEGDTHEVLYEFIEDDVFYDRSPRIHPAGGIVVLQGVQFDGTDVQVTLELDLLRELHEAAAPPSEPERPLIRASHDRASSAA